MSETTYTYSLSADFPSGQINPDKLENEIEHSNIITGLRRIDIVGNNVYLIFKDVLSVSDKTILDGNTTGPAGGLIAYHDNTANSSVESVVIVQEEFTETGGYYKFDMLKIECPANTTTVKKFDFPYPINIVNATLITDTSHTGDILTWAVNPNTTLGVLTEAFTAYPIWTLQNYSINDYVWYKSSDKKYGSTYKCKANTIANEDPNNTTYWTKQNTTYKVSNTVSDNIKVGFYVTLTNGVNTEDIGYVASVNKIDKTITVNGSSQYNFSAYTTYVQMTVLYMDNVEFGPPMQISVGASKIGASYVPPSYYIMSKYTNNGNTDKKLLAYLEYMY